MRTNIIFIFYFASKGGDLIHGGPRESRYPPCALIREAELLRLFSASRIFSNTRLSNLACEGCREELNDNMWLCVQLPSQDVIKRRCRCICVRVYVTFFYIRLQTKSIIDVVWRITTAHEYSHPIIDPASQEIRFVIVKTESESDTHSRSDQSRE